MNAYVTAGKWIGMALLLSLGACSINAAPPVAPAPVVIQQPAAVAPPGSVVVMPQ